MKHLYHLIVLAVFALPTLAQDFAEIPRRLPPEQKYQLPADARTPIEKPISTTRSGSML